MSLIKLVNEGYEQLGNYANLQIWGKKEERILYNPQTNEVYFEYKTINGEHNDGGKSQNEQQM